MFLLSDSRHGQKLIGCETALSSCGRYMMYDKVTGEFWPAKCGCRSCLRSGCRSTYAKRTQKRINQDIHLNGLNQFFTLTLDREKWPNADTAWAKIAEVWHRACHMIQRQLNPKSKIGKAARRADNLPFMSFKYVANLEKHPGSEWPHIHLSTSCFVPVDEKHRRPSEKTLGEIWSKAGGGIVVWAMQIIGGNAEYMCKQYRVSQYVTKDLANIGDFVKRRKRVIWRSRGLVKAVAEKKPVKFVKGYRPFDKFGTLVLTGKEIESIIEADMGIVVKNMVLPEEMEHIHEESEQARQDVAKAQCKLPEQSIEIGGQNLESHRARKTLSEANKAVERKKTENQCANQEIKRIAEMKVWKEYSLTIIESMDRIEANLMESFQPLCRTCPLQKNLRAAYRSKEARAQFSKELYHGEKQKRQYAVFSRNAEQCVPGSPTA